MFKIKTVAPQEATGAIAEIYGQFPPSVGVPHAIQMMSASPDFLARKVEDLKNWQGHRSITVPMQKAMRMLISGDADMTSCRDANAAMLELSGLDAEQVKAFAGSVDQWPLAPRENELVQFVVEHVTRRQPADPATIEKLREMGWTEADIFEGLAFGGMVLGVVAMVAVGAVLPTTELKVFNSTKTASTWSLMACSPPTRALKSCMSITTSTQSAASIRRF